MAVAKSFLRIEVLVFRFRANGVDSSLAVGAVRLSRYACATEVPQLSRRFPTDRFGSSFLPSPYHALKDLIRQQIVA